MFARSASRATADFLLRDYLVPTALDISPDRVVVAATMLASVVIAAGICGAAAWAVTRRRLTMVAGTGGRSVARASRTGRILIGVQAALAVVLLVDAALLARNLRNITTGSPLTAGSVLIGTPEGRVGAYGTLEPGPYYRNVLARIEALPGVEAAAFSQYRPQRGAIATDVAGRSPAQPGERGVAVETNLVSPGFFRTIGLPLLQGRDFAFDDDGGRSRVAIVSRRLARQLFGPDRGVGEHIRVSADPALQDLEIVGVADDAAVFDIRQRSESIVYIPSLQRGRLANFKFLIVRAPAAAGPSIRTALEAFGAETMGEMWTLEYARGRTLMQERVMAAVGSYFGVLALLLIAAGVHGLVSYVLSLRRKEIGIRMALGAEPAAIGRAVILGALRPGVMGIAAGLLVAVPSVRALRSVLVATTPFNPLAFGEACGALLLVTALASLVPAYRAARIEPLAELRRD